MLAPDAEMVYKFSSEGNKTPIIVCFCISGEHYVLKGTLTYVMVLFCCVHAQRIRAFGQHTAGGKEAFVRS